MSVTDLSFLLSPKSIAILGASDDFSKINGRPLKYLRAKGYVGALYPVNPKYERIAGLRCYPSVEDLPEAVDLAIIAVPARAVIDSIAALGRAQARSAIVFSSGFAEMGEPGRRLEEDLRAAAQAAGIRLCGPNCLGLINAFDGVMATFGQFAEGDTPPGPIAFVTQSGAFGTAIAALARRRGMGLGYFINTGNESDVDFVAMMRAVLDDPRITVGAGYIEGLRDGAGMLKLAEHALEHGKPLVLTKVGRTQAGARAALSHTGSLAGADAVFDGVMRGLGVVRARNEEQMLDIVEAFANCVLPRGSGVGLVTQSGGAGVLMADRAEELGLTVPLLGAATQHELRALIPAFGAAANPVDITGQFIAEPQLLHDAVRIVLSDPAVDIAVVWLQLMEAHVDTLVGMFQALKAGMNKPFVVCWVAAPDRAVRALREAGIALLRGAEPAMDAVAALIRYAEARREWLADRASRAALCAAKKHDEGIEEMEPGVVPTLVASQWLGGHDVPVVAARLASSAEEAVAAATALGYPVALKIESPDLPHKSEAGGVLLALNNADAVRQGHNELMSRVRRKRPDARLRGVIVQKMAASGVELVLGIKHDPIFGPVVMAGIGGLHVEVLGDIALRAAPVTPRIASRMLQELRAGKILSGVRGEPPVDQEALCRLVSAVSLLPAAARQRLRELDLNPVVAGPEGVTAVDWLLVLQ